MRVVSCGLYRDGVAFTTTADRAKLRNLKRNPRCLLLVFQPDWWAYVVLERQAVILSLKNTEVKESRIALGEVCRAAGGEEHSDWEEYDKAMRERRRSVVILVPSACAVIGFNRRHST